LIAIRWPRFPSKAACEPLSDGLINERIFQLPPRRFIAALLGLAFLSLAASAQADPVWWRVSDGRSEVWILGAPRIVPRDLAWDTKGLDRRLADVKTVIVGPRARGTMQAAGLIFSSFSPQPLESTLPPSLRQRFVAARESLGKSAQRYAGWKPAAASKLLLDDFFAANNLQQGGVEAQVVKLARERGAHEAPAGEFDASILIDQAKTLSVASQQTCLDAAVHDVERGAGPVRAVAAGWARGETADAPIDRIDRACVLTLPAIDAQAELTLVQETNAVAQALTAPSHSIAVFELKNLTEPGGVLDRLRARGLQVSAPTH